MKRNNTLNNGTVSTSMMLATLEAISKGCHEHQSIIDKVRNDYLDPCYLFENDHPISYGQSSIEKAIRWAVWELFDFGYILREARGSYKLSIVGEDLLRELPWHLNGYLEEELDEIGVLSGKAFFDLYKHDDGSYGAEKGSERINFLWNNVEGGK